MVAQITVKLTKRTFDSLCFLKAVLAVYKQLFALLLSE